VIQFREVRTRAAWRPLGPGHHTRRTRWLRIRYGSEPGCIPDQAGAADCGVCCRRLDRHPGALHRREAHKAGTRLGGSSV